MFNSLQKQILAVLFGLVFMLVVQVILSQTNQTQLAKNLESTSELAARVTLVLEIEKDLIDLQRKVFIYKNSPSQSTVEHFNSLTAEISKKLIQLESFGLQQEDKDKLLSMRGHLNDYQENFDSVVEGRTQRYQLFNERIKLDINRLESLFENKEAQNSSVASKLLRLNNHVLKAEISAYKYLVEPNYELISEFNQQLDLIKSCVANSDIPTKEINPLLQKIRQDFNRLTQVTRGYIFLVNVVMAGSANEFLYLTREITREVKSLQDETKMLMAKRVQQSTNRSDLITALSIALTFMAAVFLIYKIIFPIRKITQVFSRLSSGEDIAYFPGSQRNDEIGALAQAASVFSDKNRQTSELLEKTQKMNASLEQLSEETQQASLAKGEFLASMSHEIRTPMNGVVGMLGLLSRSGLNEKQLHYTSLAKQSADSLLVVINDILDFSKIEAGKLDIEILEFDLVALMSELVETYAVFAQEKHLELVLDLTEISCAIVKGDPGRLRQILNNLLGNAVKFTSEGEIVVRASLSLENQNYRLEVEVKDTGIGIESDKLGYLFESFTQADSSTTRKYGGTGLGLTITKRLCEIMGGGISATSQFGKGSCFRFNLPLDISTNVLAEMPKVDLDELNILIVDDSKTNRMTLTAQLELWGAKVSQAIDGQDAIEILDRDKANFSAAIIDMSMPRMDGESLGRAIRENKQFDDLHLIMMTSMSERRDAQRFADIGFNAYFPKPTTISDLRSALMVITEGGDALNNATPLVNQHYLKELKKNSLQSVRILLVDDNRVNLEVAQSLLEEIGLVADCVGDGKEVIVALNDAPKSSPYDFIFMDCQMPEMDGYEATKKIRAGECGEQNLTIPIIAMTANAMEGDREKCLAAGMDDYLSKPIELESMLKVLRKWLPQSLGTKPKNNQLIESELKSDLIELPEECLPSININDTEVDESINNREIDIWDKPSALKRMFGKQDRLVKIIGLFKKSTATTILAISKAQAENDIEQLRMASHALKGAAANISALKLAELAKKLELSAKETQIDEINSIVPLVLDGYDELNKTLQTFIDESG